MVLARAMLSAQDLQFVRLQLALKSIVRVYVGSEDVQVLERLAIAHLLRGDKVSDDEAGGTGVAVVAVAEDAAALGAALVDELEGFVKVRHDSRRRQVGDGDSLVDELAWETALHFCRHVQNVRHFVALEAVEILRKFLRT